MIAYHITSKDNAKKILREGFSEHRNSFTRKEDVKLYLSHPAFREFIGKYPVVLEVHIPKRHIVKRVKDKLYHNKSAVEIITRRFWPESIKKVVMR